MAIENVVLVFLDDMEISGPDNLPYLSSLDTIDLPNAFTSSPLCAPFRGTLLCGQRWDRQDLRGNGDTLAKLDEETTIAVALQDAGVATALIGKYIQPYSGTTIPPGWDRWCAFSGSAGYLDYDLNDQGTVVAKGTADADYSTDVIAAEAVEWLATAPEPFFAMITPNAPHHPFTPATRHASSPVSVPDPPEWDQPVTDGPGWAATAAMTTQQKTDTRAVRTAAARCLLAVDELIADVIAALSTRGVLGRTAVIFCTDNGNFHGRKRRYFAIDDMQKRAPWRCCTDPSLRILYPGAAGRVEDRLVGSLDIPRSILAWLGVDPILTMDGADLTPVIENTPVTWRPTLEFGLNGNGEGPIPPWWGVTDGRWTFHDYASGTNPEQLYDLDADPLESANITAANPVVVEDMQEALAALLADPLWWQHDPPTEATRTGRSSAAAMF